MCPGFRLEFIDIIITKIVSKLDKMKINFILKLIWFFEKKHRIYIYGEEDQYEFIKELGAPV